MKNMNWKDYKDYILHIVVCEVCNEDFQNVDDAVDAGTDLYVHRKCSSQWRGAWLDGGINPNFEK